MEYMIPQRSADTEALLVTFIMMEVMVSPQWLHPFERRIPCMNGIMHGAIHEIPQEEAGEKDKSICPEDQIKNRKYHGSEDQAGHRRHEQAFPVPRIFVVVAMHDINDPLDTRVFADEVESKTMHQVFEESPEKHSTYKGENDVQGGKAQLCGTVI